MAWPSNPERRARSRSLAGALALCAALVCAPASALAASASAPYRERLDKTVHYLQSLQTPEGGFSAEPEGKPEADLSAWVALALAAAGINPRDQARPDGADVYKYLTKHASELAVTTDFARELLVVDATGTSPYDFGGINLVKEILARRLSGAGREGAFTHSAGDSTPGVNDTVFAILALSPVKEPAVERAVRQAASWLVEVQDRVGDQAGGWPSEGTCSSGPCTSDVDMTGATIEALSAAARHDGEAQRQSFAAAQMQGFAYLHRAEDTNGGFPENVGEAEPNVASTAWAVQGMWSAGESPEDWVVKESAEPTDEPLGYLASMQQEDGRISYRASNTEASGAWMTAQVAPAFAGQAFPIPAPPYVPPPGSGASAPPPDPTEAGQGGQSPAPGAGVLGGGGGNGAPLFSRPQPQSQGRTRGGVRLLDSTRTRAADAAAKRREPVPQGSAASVAITTPTTTTSPTSAPGGKHHGSGSGSGATGSGNGSAASGQEVKGLLIGASGDARPQEVLEPGAPGLRSAGAGGSQARWLALAIAGLIALLLLTGSQLERRRPQVIV